ncbi:MAG: SPOR domain-containing protein [Gammaproteobacteria bacterium]
MDRQLKQRVVGAGLLVALGVIFIPIFLDNGGVDSPVPPAMDIPPAPTEDVSKRAPALEDEALDEMALRAEEDVELPPSRVQAGEGRDAAPAPIEPLPPGETLAEGVDPGLAAAPPPTDPPTDPPTEAPRMAPPVAAPRAPAAPVEPRPVPRPAPAAKPAAEPRPAPTKAVSEPKPAPAPAPRPAEARPPAVTGWAVQLGSFGSDANARKLVDKLRGAGFKAYSEARLEQGATVYKVRVGPAPTRTEAERVRQRIEAKFDQRGMLVPAR